MAERDADAGPAERAAERSDEADGAASTPVTSTEARIDPATERVEPASSAPAEPATVPGTDTAATTGTVASAETGSTGETERLPEAGSGDATRAIGRPETQVLDRDGAHSAPAHAPVDALTRVAPAQTREAPVPALGGGTPAPPRSPGAEARRVVRRVLHAIASALRAVGMICALILLVHVVLAVTAVNPENTVAAVIAELADVLVLSFRDLFLPADPVAMVAVNYGLAALFWAVLGSAAARVVRALAAVLR